MGQGKAGGTICKDTITTTNPEMVPKPGREASTGKKLRP